MLVKENFEKPQLNKKLRWHHEPEIWQIKNNQLIVTSEKETDFWQRTHYGFQADNGHFLFAEVKGDFVMESRVNCQFIHQYDQAGLMVRVSDECWVKTSVEKEIGEPNKLGAVVTNHGYSDWSTQDVIDDFLNYRLRITRTGSDYQIEYFNGQDSSWIQLRLFHLFDQSNVQAGIYCCSPKEGGFSAAFDYLLIEGKTSRQ
jgi:hypothetical protein